MAEWPPALPGGVAMSRWTIWWPRAASDAAGSPAAEDAAPLVGPESSDAPGAAPFDRGPEETDLSVLRDVLGGLGGAFARAEAEGRVLAGFAQHTIDTVYLGSSTGLRRRHAQPTGSLHLVGRGADGVNSAWVGAGTADFSDVTIGEMEERLVGRLAWGAPQRPRCRALRGRPSP